MKYILILSIVLLLGLASASEGIRVSIKNDSLSVQGFIVSSVYGEIPASFFDGINTTLNNTVICESETITCGNESITRQKNCRLNIDYQVSKEFKFNQSVGTIIGDSAIQDKYDACVAEKISYSVGVANCVKDKERYADYETNYTVCKESLSGCNSQLSSITGEKNTCTTEAESKKNDRWLWGIGGLVIGILVILFKEGKIWNPKAKQVGSGFNPQQAG